MEDSELEARGTYDARSVATCPSYSPGALHHLPQPIPNDLPPQLDRTIFTFQDAFEDLIATSHGQCLPDIMYRYQQRQLLRQMFPSGEPTWFWLHRMEAQRSPGNPRPITFLGSIQSSWDRLHQELDRTADEVWRGIPEDQRNSLHQARYRERDCMDSSAGVDITELNRGRQCRREPNSFYELYSDTHSRFEENTSTWNTFRNLFRGLGAETDTCTRWEPTKHAEKRTVTCQNERVDSNGYLHSVVTRRILDDEGKEIGVETSHVIRPAEKHYGGVNKKDAARSEGLYEFEKDRKRSSWFWK